MRRLRNTRRVYSQNKSQYVGKYWTWWSNFRISLSFQFTVPSDDGACESKAIDLLVCRLYHSQPESEIGTLNLTDLLLLHRRLIHWFMVRSLQNLWAKQETWRLVNKNRQLPPLSYPYIPDSPVRSGADAEVVAKQPLGICVSYSRMMSS